MIYTFSTFYVLARRLDVTAEAEVQSLHRCLRDIGTFLQAIGRLAHLFVGDENFNRKLTDGQVVFDRCAKMPGILSGDFQFHTDTVHAERHVRSLVRVSTCVQNSPVPTSL